MCRSELLVAEPAAGRVAASAAMGHATVSVTVAPVHLANQTVLTTCQSCFGPVPDDGTAHTCWRPPADHRPTTTLHEGQT